MFSCVCVMCRREPSWGAYAVRGVRQYVDLKYIVSANSRQTTRWDLGTIKTACYSRTHTTRHQWLKH